MGQSWTSKPVSTENFLLDVEELIIASGPNKYHRPPPPPNKYEMAVLIDHEKMNYGQVNLCLAHETRNCLLTTPLISGPNLRDHSYYFDYLLFPCYELNQKPIPIPVTYTIAPYPQSITL